MTGFAIPHDLLDHAALLEAAEARPDADAKLRGSARFLTDRIARGQLFGVIVGSPHAHARVIGIDAAAAMALPGVRAVVTARDVPGVARYGLRHVDRPVLCGSAVRCVGDPVAAIAADTAEIARAAAALVRVVYEALPVVDDARAALEPGAPAVHPGGNLLHRFDHARGDPGGALAACAHVVEDVYTTPRQMHAYLETEGGVVEPDGAGGFLVAFGGQSPARDRQVIAAVLGIAPEKVRVIASPVGGSYGGKDELTIQPIAALLAWKTGCAVRMHLTRPESVDLGVKRHAMTIRMRTGCDAAGRVCQQQVDILADTGAYATHGPEVLDAAAEHAVGPYAWAAVQLSARLAYTNNGIAGAFRGFGAVQAQFALERQMDRLARRVGLDPIEFRRLNLCAPDAPGPLGQQVAPFDGPHRALDVLRQHRLWSAPRPARDSRWRYGTGLALVHRSDGFASGGPNRGRVALALAADGAIELRSSFTEMGQNLTGAAVALVAARLGCGTGDVRAVLGDTSLTPDSGPTAASRATNIVWRALDAAIPAWRSAVLDLAARRLDRPVRLRFAPGGLADADGRLSLSYAELAAGATPAERPVREVELQPEESPGGMEAAHYAFGACAALARVRVDTWTGAVQAQKLVIAAALGPVVSAMGLLGQLEGGAVTGLGMVLTEHLPMEGGRYLVRNLDGYLVPTIADAPDIEIIAIRNLRDDDRLGPRGAGEIGVNVAVPAIANALSDALDGAALRHLPVTPEQVFAAVEALS